MRSGSYFLLVRQFMADGDGWMVLRSMAERFPAVPVVSISAAPPERPANFPKGTDFAVHLLKPLDHVRLLSCISDLLGLSWRPEPRGEAVSSPPSPAKGPRPDAASMAALREMIAAGRISDIMTWADAAKTTEPRCANFADEVRAAARHLDFPKLMTLLGTLEDLDPRGGIKRTGEDAQV